MKLKKLLLVQDVRGDATITYKEIVGKKIFYKKIIDFTTADKNQAATTFYKKLKLYDAVAKVIRVQNVLCQVISNEKKYIVIGVK